MKKEKEEIPQYIIDGIARMLLPEIQKFYESDEGKAEFEKWKAAKEEEQYRGKLAWVGLPFKNIDYANA